MFELMPDSYLSTDKKIITSAKLLIYDSYQNKFLVIKRGLNHQHNPGLWELPGGKIIFPELINVGLSREVMEETDLLINLEDTEILSIKSRKITDKNSSYNGFIFELMAGFINQSINLEKVQPSDEHIDKKLITIDYNCLKDQDLTLDSKLIINYFLDNIIETS